MTVNRIGSPAGIIRRAAAKRGGTESQTRNAVQEAAGALKSAAGKKEDSASPPKTLPAAFTAASGKESRESGESLEDQVSFLRNKMLLGKLLTHKEKKFLRERFPVLALAADRAEWEARHLERKLKDSRSEEERKRIFTETKMRLIAGSGRDSTIPFAMPAVERVFHSTRRA